MGLLCGLCIIGQLWYSLQTYLTRIDGIDELNETGDCNHFKASHSSILECC